MTLPSQDALAQGSAASLSRCPRLTRRASSVQALLSQPGAARERLQAPRQAEFSGSAECPQPPLSGPMDLHPRAAVAWGLRASHCSPALTPPSNVTRSKPSSTHSARVHSTAGGHRLCFGRGHSGVEGTQGGVGGGETSPGAGAGLAGSGTNGTGGRG